MFHTNSYPADKNLNSGLVTLIKGSSLGAAGFEMYMLYQLVKHLYEYITMVHREPDVLMLIALAYGAVTLYKIGMCAYGFHLAGTHTDRTPENLHGYSRNLTFSTLGRLLVNGAIYVFLNMHVKHHNHLHGKMDSGVEDSIHLLKMVLAV